MLSNPCCSTSGGKLSGNSNGMPKMERMLLRYSARLSRRTTVPPTGEWRTNCASNQATIDSRSTSNGCGFFAGGIAPAANTFMTRSQ